jgi:DNA-binding transcriptional regulator YhcF (GntR family)
MMRTDAPPLLPIFRSRGQAQLLARIFLRPDDRAPLGELARQIGVDPATVQREVTRLEEAGLVKTQRIGRSKVVEPNEQSPYFRELSGLLFKAFGPASAIGSSLERVPGVEAAFVFGSWASRYQGEPGPPPGDIDVLVIGKPDRRALARVASDCSQALGLEVNTTVVSSADWSTGSTPFLRTVKEAPLVPLFARTSPILPRD